MSLIQTPQTLEDQADRDAKRTHAVDVLLARVPPAPPPAQPRSTQWVESDPGKTDPRGLYR